MPKVRFWGASEVDLYNNAAPINGALSFNADFSILTLSAAKR